MAICIYTKCLREQRTTQAFMVPSFKWPGSYLPISLRTQLCRLASSPRMYKCKASELLSLLELSPPICLMPFLSSLSFFPFYFSFFLFFSSLKLAYISEIQVSTRTAPCVHVIDFNLPLAASFGIFIVQ